MIAQNSSASDQLPNTNCSAKDSSSKSARFQNNECDLSQKN